jgi:two-component system NtrC family sensor kinase
MIDSPRIPTIAPATVPDEKAAGVLAEPADYEAVNADRILVVDDEEPLRNLFAASLREQYECDTAGSANEALERLAEVPYALVISDVMMPGRNGVELLREITARYPETAVIMVSGVDRSQRVRDALSLGAADYLIKPCELEVLSIAVERALERRRLQCTARKYKADIEKQNKELALRAAELQRLQAQIIHSEKMASLGQLAAGVAHELNNPAGFIYGNMDMLKDQIAGLQELLTAYDQMDLPPKAASLIEPLKIRIGYDKLVEDLNSIVVDCLEGAERIRDVVQNLRLFSRLDEAELKQVDLHEGIDSTIRLLSQYYSSGRVVIRREFGELPLVSCYAAQLNQVWMNLLANAAQAVSGNGEVRITTKLADTWAVISIQDSGCGISEEVQARIFDPFFTTKPVGEGTGLGLSISYGIIERHGGTIAVASTPGMGTTFTIRIPTAPDIAVPKSNQLERAQFQEVFANDIQTIDRR